MSEPYRSAAAVEAAIRNAARNAYRADKSMSVPDRIRQEYFRRFLSRIFSAETASNWLLKGGTGVLARVSTARSTTDVDLVRANHTLDLALAELQTLASVDLGDFFRFVYVDHDVTLGGNQQSYVDGYGVNFDVYVGADRKGRLHVDLVVGSVVTGAVSVIPPANRLNLPRLASYDYRVYPIVDQIADKVCATMTQYAGQPSSREKDLVDLVIIAMTQAVDADALKRAITVETQARSLAPFRMFTIPPTWGAVYRRLAREVPHCVNAPTVNEAAALMAQFIDPVMSDSVSGSRWSPQESAWR